MDWYPLGEEDFLRKMEIFKFCLPKEVEDVQSCFLFTSSPFNGPIAFVSAKSRNSSKGLPSTRPKVFICTSCGSIISSFEWKSGKLIWIAWSEREELLCLQEDGQLLLYDIFSTFITHYNLFPTNNTPLSISPAHCFFYPGLEETSIIFFSCRHDFYFLSVNMQNEKPFRLKKIFNSVYDESQKALPWFPILRDENFEILTCGTDALYLFDASGNFDKISYDDLLRLGTQPHKHEHEHPPPSTLSLGHVKAMCATSNADSIALLFSSAYLWIGSTSFKKKKFFDRLTFLQEEEEEAGNIAAQDCFPNFFKWMANDEAVLVVYREINLLVVTAAGHIASYILESPVLLLTPEMDGCRITTLTTHEFLQRVPDLIVSIFKIGSLSHSAILVDAYKAFLAKSTRAYEFISMIKERIGGLETAVEECIKAAMFESHDSNKQSLLLKAAIFGKSFLAEKLSSNSLSKYVFFESCSLLRILNALKNVQSLQIYLTTQQAKFIGLHGIIAKLIRRRHFALALKFAEFMKEYSQIDFINLAWARYKVRTCDKNEVCLADEIASRLDGYSIGPSSLCEVASYALKLKRRKLVKHLLQKDLPARSLHPQQIPLLIAMSEIELASRRSIEMGNPNLLWQIILHLKESRTHGDFMLALNRLQMQPLAHLFLKSCDLQQKLHFFIQQDNFLSQAKVYIHLSYQHFDYSDRLLSLKKASTALVYASSNDDFNVKMLDESMKLLKSQKALEQKLNKNFVDLSLHQTLLSLLKLGRESDALELKKEFKFAEKRFSYLMAIVAAENHKWHKIDSLINNRKSGFSFEYAAGLAIQLSKNTLAQNYISKMSDCSSQVKLLLKMKIFDKAYDLALEKKSVESMEFIKDKILCSGDSKELLPDIEKFLALHSN